MGQSRTSHNRPAATGLEGVKRIASEIEGKIPLVLFNPRLVRSARWRPTLAALLQDLISLIRVCPFVLELHSKLSMQRCHVFTPAFKYMLAMASRSLPACSGDVGVGLNARRLASRFMSTFTTTYSLRPIGEILSVCSKTCVKSATGRLRNNKP